MSQITKLAGNTIEGHWKSCSRTNNYKYRFGFRSNHSTDRFLSFLNEKIFERLWQQNIYWHDSDWPTKDIWHDKQNTAWETSSNRLFEEYDLLVWILFSRASLYRKSCKLGFKIRTYFIWCYARFIFKPSTLFNLCQWYEPNCRMDLYLNADIHDCSLKCYSNVIEIKKQLTKETSAISLIGL